MVRLPPKYIDPLDNQAYKFGNYFLPFFKKIGFTPNIITSIGKLFAIISLYGLYKENFLVFILFSIIRYIFDCIDGEMARKYNMISEFGDIYEHISDNIYLGLIIIILYMKCKSKNYLFLTLVLLAICVGFILNWSCESDYINSTSKFHFSYLCKNKSEKYLKVLKFFGPAFSSIYLYIIIFYFLKYYN